MTRRITAEVTFAIESHSDLPLHEVAGWLTDELQMRVPTVPMPVKTGSVSSWEQPDWESARVSRIHVLRITEQEAQGDKDLS